MVKVLRSFVRGPLEPHVAGFAEQLIRQGYFGGCQACRKGWSLPNCGACWPAATGRRDFAVMLLLARMGLRAGEVAGLGLDDIDWRHGEVVIVGKGNRSERLPLPDEIGAAIAAYLRRGRPADAEGSSVFVRVHAPHRPLTTGGVTMIVFDGARAGLPRMHAHRLPPYRGHRDAARRGPAGRSRAGPSAPLSDVHGDLRQGRPRGAGRAGPTLAR